MKLREYQKDAVLATMRYFKRYTGNPVVAMPTGTGKSLVIGAMTKIALGYPGQRVLCLAHVKELIQQNFNSTHAIFPDVDAGIYSAGLKRRDTDNAVIFAGIASVYKRAAELGRFHLVLIDECHLVSDAQDTMYQALISDLLTMEPRLKVIGYSATPYRLRSGLLTDGSLFTHTCFDMTGLKPYNRLVSNGYLAPLVALDPDEKLDVKGVHTRAGEFIPGELQRAVNHKSITERAVAEIVARAGDRKHWLLFASGVDHCESVTEALRRLGIAASFVHSRISNDERTARINAFKRGELTAIVNNNILTTGFDFPGIDLIGMLRPTLSPGLWVQMLGRGTRPAEGKKDCLVLDFAGNTRRLGQINNVVLPNWGARRRGGERIAPVKTCEQCKTINHAAARFCEFCGAEFPRIYGIASRAAAIPVVANDKPDIRRMRVDTVTYAKHKKKGGRPSLKVTYRCGLNFYREWVCLEHAGYAQAKAVEWWVRRTLKPVPDTIDDALELANHLKQPGHIDVNINGRYPEIIGFSFDT